jgi:hypothetical protein
MEGAGLRFGLGLAASTGGSAAVVALGGAACVDEGVGLGVVRGFDGAEVLPPSRSSFPSLMAFELVLSVLRAPQAWSKPRLPSRAKRKERTERITPPNRTV